MKFPKYQNGQIPKRLQGEIFIANRDLLSGPLGCVLVGHELCAHCGCHLEIWRTSANRYMALTQEGSPNRLTAHMKCVLEHWGVVEGAVEIKEVKG